MLLEESTIIFIIFWDVLIFYQIYLSPQVKRSVIISDKDGITYHGIELPDELLNDLRPKEWYTST